MLVLTAPGINYQGALHHNPSYSELSPVITLLVQTQKPLSTLLIAKCSRIHLELGWN